MKPNLEIPVSLVFKERKIAQVTSDEELILRALKKCARVAVAEDGKTARINIAPARTRLTVAADPKLLEQLQFFV